MSLLIKGMDMPKACRKCPFHNASICTAKGSPVSLQIYLDGKKPFDCPLVEIPTPHGRLIDADSLPLKDMDKANYPSNYIKSAPTIIEAEE